MVWLIFAVTIWVYIIFFIRPGWIKRLWSAALWSILVAYFFNVTLLERGLYLFLEDLYTFQGIPIAYLVGTAGIGIILIRYLPDERWWQFAYLIFFAAAISGLEFFAVENGYLKYIQLSIYESFIFRLIAFITITWLSNLTVRRKKTYFYR